MYVYSRNLTEHNIQNDMTTVYMSNVYKYMNSIRVE